VFTSNRLPSELYHGGLHRRYFEPFIGDLYSYTRVMPAHTNDYTDYRHRSTPASGVVFFPANASTHTQLVHVFHQLCGASSPRLVSVPVMMGRSLELQTAVLGSVCLCTFAELCDTEKGAADYKALCANFHTIVLSGVPRLSAKVCRTCTIRVHPKSSCVEPQYCASLHHARRRAI
jgi:predicted ATPase